MNLQTARLRIKVRRYTSHEVWVIEVATPRGWCEFAQFQTHESARAFLSAKKIRANQLSWVGRA